MSQGKKISPELVYKIMASYAVTGNYAQTSRELGVPYTTVRQAVGKNSEKPEFVKLSDETKESFAEAATNIIEKGLTLLNRRFERAINQEAILDDFIEEIAETNKLQLSQQEKTALISKLRALQLQDVKAITTAIGTLYDKRALAEGGTTDNVSVSIKLPEGIDDYAG